MSPRPQTVRLAEADCLTPLGQAAATHAALQAGRSALALVPVLGSAGGDPVPVALIPGHEMDEAVPPVWLAELERFLAPVRDGGWGTARRPVCFASSNFGVGSLYRYQQGRREATPLAYSTPERCTAQVRQRLGWGPHAAIFSHACVSAHIALLHASRLLWAGVADAVLVVSFDFVSPFVAGGFHALKILNSARPAPYQVREFGAIGLGDGAAYAVVTRDRGDFEVAGQAVYNEMHHVTGNEPNGTGFDAVVRSLDAADQKLWLKGHGTGTLEAGRLECATLDRLLPAAPMVGWKGALGHTLGSCGLVELAVAAQAIRAGTTPGTVGSAPPTFSPQVALEAFDNRGFDGALCSSNAFGGAHAALVLRHA